MTSHPSKYYRPKNIDDALALLAIPGNVPLAGGTKLLAGEFDGPVVDIQDLGLDRIEQLHGQLKMGSMVRLADLAEYLSSGAGAEDPTHVNAARLLLGSIKKSGPNTYRNAATVGGSVAARLPDSELLATLLVLDCQLVLLRPEQLSISLAQYLEEEQPVDGLITSLAVTWSDGSGGSERVARTPADYPIVSVTVWRPEGGSPALAATGIDDRPVRLYGAEQALAGRMDETKIALASRLAAERCRHMGDFRGDSAYRSEMAAILTRRLLVS